MKYIRSPQEIAEMMCYCVSCDDCKIKDECDKFYNKTKTEEMCVKMWFRWLTESKERK